MKKIRDKDIVTVSVSNTAISIQLWFEGFMRLNQAEITYVEHEKSLHVYGKEGNVNTVTIAETDEEIKRVKSSGTYSPGPFHVPSGENPF